MIVLALLLAMQATPAAAPQSLTSNSDIVAQKEEARQLAGAMLKAPEFVAGIRRQFETALRRELEHPADGSKSDLEPDLLLRLVQVMGDAYEVELKAGLDRLVDVASGTFADHLAKYELDRLVEFVGTSGGRKFIAFAFQNGSTIKTGDAIQSDAAERFARSLTAAELADLQAAMEPALLLHWKQAMLEIRPATTAWSEAARKGAQPQYESLAKETTREFYRSKGQLK